MSRRLDDTDRALLRALSTDGRRTLRALAKDVELSEPAVRERIQRLERDQVITGYRAAVAPESVDAATAAFIALRFGPGEDVRSTVDEALRREPRVLEAHQVAGDDCYLIKVRVASTGELADLLDRIRAIPPIQSTGTTIVLRTIFERPLLAGDAERTHGDGPAPGANGG
ncbi:Lrp/AsnC family transcriptional regulator [Streptomyces pactum]|uniref:Lrp/AsnC family transcriptional regulator n=1 Tax=Streptomyces pactum TaxID=68249 RepID=A0ABS0NDZ3_9ACTN|nr:Lrp/AsnC family transcriptional regulator [Streptomyces pactum]MBH5333376.1 Lrp/AsnC family transcriptional regulator [Streptomyces pactum]